MSFDDEKIPLHSYESLLRKGVRIACTTTRLGGVSSAQYGTLNLGYSGEETPSRVAENRVLLCRALEISTAQLILPQQTHGSACRCIDAGFLQATAAEQTALLEGVDALVTDQQGCCIGVTTADCVPVLLYDPVHRAIGAVHAGWRGTVQHILQRVIAQMGLLFQTAPCQLLATIGPSICPCCFEVGQEVVEDFQIAGYPSHLVRSGKKDGKFYIDLWEANRLDLLSAGVSNAAIETAYLCTYEMHEVFFSARRLGIRSGRMATVIGL